MAAPRDPGPLFRTTFRRMPTAHAEGLDRIGARHRKGLGETRLWAPFRSTRVLGARRRHAPSNVSCDSRAGRVRGHVVRRWERARPHALFLADLTGVDSASDPAADSNKVRVDMCVDMWVDMCVDMCVDM